MADAAAALRPVQQRQHGLLHRSVHIAISSTLCSEKEGSPYSIAECTVPDLILVLDSQPAGDVSHKPSGRLPLLSARPSVTLATVKTAAASFTAW